jgi:hypothetical protein
MFEGKVYHARADAERALAVAATESPFTITVRFLDGLTQAQMDAFAAAADRWVTVIVGDLPEVRVDGEVIDDVLVVARGKDIDGDGHILGQARITHQRRRGPEPWSLLPARGEMTFDKADLARMEAAGTLGDVITHEMGHVIGVGGLWAPKGLLAGPVGDPRFTGAAAVAEYRKLSGAATDVPVENTGGPGTAGVHWREHDFGNELMTGFVNRAVNPLSRITAASLGDLGYQVDIDAADEYELPELQGLVEVAFRVPCHDVTVSVEPPTVV